MSFFTIARLTVLEAQRRKLLWAVALMSAAFLLLFGIAFYFVYQDFRRSAGEPPSQFLEVANGLLLAGLYVVNFLGVLLAVLASVDTIAGEISSGAIHTIVTKPLRRWEIVIGKWLGLSFMLALFIVLLSVALMAIVWAISRYQIPNPASGVALMVLAGWVVLSLSILGGTRLSTLANGVVVFMMYGLAFIAGWIEQIGSLLRNGTAVDIGITVSLIMPGEAMWRRGAYLMQSALMRDLGVTPFSSSTAPSPAMVGYTLVYIAVMLVAALYLFQKRDL